MNANAKKININYYNYQLEDSKIAKHPLENRDQSKLLYWNHGNIESKLFPDVADLIEKDSLLIRNNSKVIQARLYFKKDSGSVIEIFCLKPIFPIDYLDSFRQEHTTTWSCMVGNLRRWKNGDTVKIEISDSITLKAFYVEKGDNMSHTVRFEWSGGVTFAEILEKCGELPIPPYLNRDTEESDKSRYQTIYSKIDGSVAAPTAGLHFTKKVEEKLINKGITIEEVTLHVGAGTFQPVKSEELGEHKMHNELFEIRKGTIETIIKKLGNIVAVGTTSVRTLESLYYIGCQIAAGDESFIVSQWVGYESQYQLDTISALQTIVDYMNNKQVDIIHASTEILIVPGFEFRIVNRLITNFHQPKSTLLLLISAFVGEENWRTIYNFALENNYRFLSYGDSSFLIKQ